MSINNVLASVAVNDLKASVKWYEKVFGRPADSTPMSEVAEWRFGHGGCLQVYQLPERAGSGSFTLAVTHIDQEIEKLKKLGVDTSQQASGGQIKTVMIADPDRQPHCVRGSRRSYHAIVRALSLSGPSTRERPRRSGGPGGSAAPAIPGDARS